jgi:ACS family hexuronate transporter-like MFS transporter
MPPSTPIRRWILCALLFAATTLNYLDRQTLSILAPFIQKDLQLNNADLGLLFSLFYYAYTFAQFLAGPVLDRANLRWAFGLSVLAWSIVAGGTALTTGFGSLIVFRLLLGIAESPNWPAAMRIVARALPPQDRPLGNGIFTSGTSVGALIAPGLILGLSTWLGWRGAFVGVASLATVWLAAWFLFTKHHSLDEIWRSELPSASVSSGYGEVIRSRAFWKVFAITILVNPCLYFNLNWLPTYLTQQRGMNAGKEVAGVLTLIYLALDLGYICCGLATRYLSHRWGIAPARRAVFLTASLLLASSVFVPLLPDLGTAITVLMIVNFAAGAWIAMYLTMAQEVSPIHVSTAAGLLGGSGSLAGALAMWWVGRVTQTSGNFLAPFAAVSVAALLAAAAGWVVTRAQHPLDRDSPRTLLRADTQAAGDHHNDRQ